MAIDPICNMVVDESTPIRAERDGRTYYCCCESCRQKFLGNDTLALGMRHEPTHHAAGAKYICPMCPEVASDVPAACPKCGMALEPAAPSKPQRRVVYTCPMHPEVKSDQPGACPICGMALEPTDVEVQEDDPELRDMTRRLVVAVVF